MYACTSWCATIPDRSGNMTSHWFIIPVHVKLELQPHPFSLKIFSDYYNLVMSDHIADSIIIHDYFNLIERFLSCTVRPSFNSFTPDQVVVESDPAMITLSCSAEGNPTPAVTWTRVFDNGSDSDLLFNGSSYEISNNRNNAGTYRCKADNGIGAINQTILVTVNCKYSAFSSFSG